MTLDILPLGQDAVITAVGGEGPLRCRLLDMGLIPGAKVTVVKYAPMGDPMELNLYGYSLTLRKAEAARIEVEPGAVDDAPVILPRQEIPHPRYGEEGDPRHSHTHTEAHE